jgi:outer membrane protein insertion porin family
MKPLKALLFSFLFSLPLVAQITDLNSGHEYPYKQPQEYEIGPIRVVGADNYDHQAIKLISGLRQGQRIMIPGDKITKAIRNLWDEGIFSDVEIAVEKEINGVVYLVISLKPRPKLSRFKFVGINRREADKLREEISLYSGKTITENLVFNTQNKIKGFYREKGYYGIQVDIHRQVDTLMNDSEMFTIHVDKGNKIKIGTLDIQGNESVPTWKLRMAMKDTKQKAFWRFFKRSKFSVSAYERDKLALIEKFNAIGLRDAAITYDTVYQADSKNLAIIIRVEEGSKYYFGNIEWVGNTKFSSGYLDTVLGIKYGDVYNKPLLSQRLEYSADGRDISSLYQDRGYLFFQIIAV